MKAVSYEDMKALIGKRVEIPVHYDTWMRGARFGKVVGRRRSKLPGHSDCLLVRMDHPGIKRCVKVWSIDCEYLKVQ